MPTSQSQRGTGEYLRLIFRQLPGAVWATDRNLRFTYVLGRTLAMDDIDPRRLVGRTIYDFVGSTDPRDPAVAHHLAALLGDRQSFEYVRNERAFDVTIEPLTDDDGAVVGCVGVALDVTEQRQTRERLARSQAQLAEAQRVAHIGSFEWDILTDCVSWSDELRRIYGLSVAEPAGTLDDLLSRVHPEDQALVRTIILNACAHPTPFAYEHRILRPDGGVRQLHVTGDVIADNPGTPVRMVGSCWDITTQHDTTQKLQRSLSLVRATLDATGDGFLVIDRSGRVVAHNKRFLTMWHVPISLVSNGDDKALVEFISTQLADPRAFVEGVRTVNASSVESFDVLRFADGRTFERCSRPQLLNGELVGRVWSFHDVTERERLLRRATFLADATRLLSSLDVNNALSAVAHLTVPFLAECCAIDLIQNGEPKRLVVAGGDASTAAGERPPQLHASVFNGHSTIYNQRGRSHLGVPVVGRDGVRGAITLMAQRDREYSRDDLDLADELGRRVALSLDNSRLYAAARDAVSSRDEFLAIAAHEIRGPLTSTHLAVQGLLRGTFPPPAARRALETIQREDRRLARFVDDLLDLGRIRTGQFHFVLEDVDLGVIVRDVVSRQADDLLRAGSPVTIRTEGNLVGQWDKFRLEQVVTNLLSNAIKYGNGKPIEVAAEAQDGHAMLTVVDRGVGVPEDMLMKIFDPYQRAVDTRHYGGLGLGLHIAKTIVDGLGGTMSVDSKPGAGARFRVELPVSRSAV